MAQPTLTPVRSPMPPRLRRRRSLDARVGGPTTAKKPRRPAAASSSEKETPTIVMTEGSPFPHGDSGGGRTTVASLARAASTAGGERLFRDDGSSPGSRAGQSLATSSRSSNDDGEGTTQSRDEEGGPDNRAKVVNMVQHVLGSGIASICRLRQLFPRQFFKKFDLDGTTITQFDEGLIGRVARGVGAGEEDGSDNEEEDELSMVKSFQPQTQKSLSPLTEHTQKRRSSTQTQDGGAYDETERRQAMEALLLLRWIKKDGIDALLREDNLASVVFGICVPSSSAAGAGTAEVVESYSFEISFHQPSVETDFDDAQARESTGEFFQNLNGFRPGCSLSQMAPCKTQYSQTQASAYSQASSQHFSANFSLSQRHTQHSRSQAEMSQVASMMSQSIHQQVKKHRGSIPETRFLTLRVGLKKAVQRDELPSALKGTGQSKSACIHTSPVPCGNGATSKMGANGTMRVTPLGRIVEKGYSGLCVDVAARSRADDGKEEERDDDKSVHFSQALPLTQPPENEDAQPSEKDGGEETELGAAVESQKAGTARASSQVEDLLEDKENDDVDALQVGGRAFAKPYKGKQYALADILDHRVVKSSIDGREVEEYKCSFRSDELKAAGQTKQWRKGSKMMSYHHMSTRVEEALKGNGGIAVDDVAKEAKVELVFVQEIASKSKASLKDKNNVGRTSRKRYKGNARG